MPRKAPTSYPEMYATIIDVTLKQGEFDVDCGTPQEAKSFRNTYYSYCKALVEVTGKQYSKEQLDKWHQLGALASKIMAKQVNSTIIFYDKAKYGHASYIKESLKKKGLDFLIPPESQDD